MINDTHIPTLNFFSNKTNRIIQEDFNNPNSIMQSIFYQSYQDAFSICRDIVNNFDEADINNSYNKIISNNIVSFIGTRGIGKSSFMLNFVDLLCKNDAHLCAQLDLNAITKRPNMNDVYFRKIKLIDPTLLDQKESLFEYIIGEMFKDLDEWLKKSHNNMNELVMENNKLLQNLLDDFNKMHGLIIKARKSRKGEINEYETTIESLKTIAASSSIKDCFKKLVSSYLEFFSSYEETHKAWAARYLLVPIDDMDLLTDNVLEYTEEIKKFMRIPGVIVLLNYDIDRFSQIILNYYLKTNEKLKLYAQCSDYEDLRKRVREQLSIVSNYMEKVFPIDQRVVLPSLDLIMRKCKFRYKHSNDMLLIDIKKLNNDKDFDVISNDVFQFVMSTLFHLTSIRFAKQMGGNNYLPSNLREIHNFMKDMFQECTDSECNKRLLVLRDCDKVFDWLANDIIYRWGKDNLHRQQYQFLVEMWNITDEDKLDFIYEYFLKREGSLNSQSNYNRRKSDKDNKSKCKDFENYLKQTKKKQISFGDLFYLCRYFCDRDLVDEGRWDSFSFAILALLSIKLRKLEWKPVSSEFSKMFTPFIDERCNYFGFSSLRLLNIRESKQIESGTKLKKTVLTTGSEISTKDITYVLGHRDEPEAGILPIGHIELKINDDRPFYINISGFINNLKGFVASENKLTESDKVEASKLYKKFEALFFFIECDTYEIIQKEDNNFEKIINKIKDKKSILLPANNIDSPDDIDPPDVITHLLEVKDYLTFDILNPCFRVMDAVKICEDLMSKLKELNFDKTMLKSWSLVNDTYKKENESVEVHKIRLDKFMRNLKVIPFSDLQFMSALMNDLEDNFSRKVQVGDDLERYELTLKTIPEIYRHIRKYLSDMDKNFFPDSCDAETKSDKVLYFSNMVLSNESENPDESRQYDIISGRFDNCELMKIIIGGSGKEDDRYSFSTMGISISKILQGLVKESRYNENLRVGLEKGVSNDSIFPPWCAK